MPSRGAMRHLIALLACGLLVWGGSAFAQTPTPDPCDPTADAAFFTGVGDSAFRLRDYSRADRAYTCALARDPASPDALARRGYARSVQGDDAGALADFEAALTLNESAIDVYVNRGALYMRQGNFALAIADLTLALALEPDNTRALHNRAVVHAAEGSFALALADIDAALAVAPDDPDLHAAKGAIYLGLANASYGQFRALAGDTTPFFGGAPAGLYLAFERNTVTGNFGEWLGLLRPGRD
ncbi:MAG: tetratricopeptide repeat protein [Chloroflexota bacterium]|nr:tetratricopeptide repeat protein [Chloroflexota bacterium]